MSNEQKTNTEETQAQHTSSEAWQEVGKQFQTLGESLSAAFRTAWNDEQNRKRMQDMQKGVESMLHDVGKAMDETAKSPQMQQAKSEAQKAAESLRTATEHTAQELRPLILEALRNLNAELAKFVGNLERSNSGAHPNEPTVPVEPAALPEPPKDEGPAGL